MSWQVRQFRPPVFVALRDAAQSEAAQALMSAAAHAEREAERVLHLRALRRSVHCRFMEVDFGQRWSMLVILAGSPAVVCFASPADVSSRPTGTHHSSGADGWPCRLMFETVPSDDTFVSAVHFCVPVSL